jgi:cytochrome b561
MRIHRTHEMTTPAARYDRVAVALHWLIAAALLAQIGFGFLLDDIAPRGTPARSGVINLHKSFGMVLGVLIVLRLAWRLAHRPPPLPGTLPPWQRRAAKLSHRLLYACMLVMPLSGYVASNFSRRGVVFFGTPLAPWGPDLPAVYAFLGGVHQVTAVVLVGLITVHVAAALKHALVDRDGVFRRMAPFRGGVERGAASLPEHQHP